jgi:hypothetical protein
MPIKVQNAPPYRNLGSTVTAMAKSGRGLRIHRQVFATQDFRGSQTSPIGDTEKTSKITPASESSFPIHTSHILL